MKDVTIEEVTKVSKVASGLYLYAWSIIEHWRMYFEAHPNAEIKHREEKKKHEHHKEEKKVDEVKVVEEKANGDVKHTEHSNDTKVEAVNNA